MVLTDGNAGVIPFHGENPASDVLQRLPGRRVRLIRYSAAVVVIDARVAVGRL